MENKRVNQLYRMVATNPSNQLTHFNENHACVFDIVGMEKEEKLSGITEFMESKTITVSDKEKRIKLMNVGRNAQVAVSLTQPYTKKFCLTLSHKTKELPLYIAQCELIEQGDTVKIEQLSAFRVSMDAIKYIKEEFGIVLAENTAVDECLGYLEKAEKEAGFKINYIMGVANFVNSRELMLKIIESEAFLKDPKVRRYIANEECEQTKKGADYHEMVLKGEAPALVKVEALDRTQEQAVFEVLYGPDAIVCFDGPPGTGKTTTDMAIVMNAVNAGAKTLITAQNKAALEACLRKLDNYGLKNACLVLDGSSEKRLKESIVLSLEAVANARCPEKVDKNLLSSLDEYFKMLLEANEMDAYEGPILGLMATLKNLEKVMEDHSLQKEELTKMEAVALEEIEKAFAILAERKEHPSEYKEVRTLSDMDMECVKQLLEELKAGIPEYDRIIAAYSIEDVEAFAGQVKAMRRWMPELVKPKQGFASIEHVEDSIELLENYMFYSDFKKRRALAKMKKEWASCVAFKVKTEVDVRAALDHLQRLCDFAKANDIYNLDEAYEYAVRMMEQYEGIVKLGQSISRTKKRAAALLGCKENEIEYVYDNYWMLKRFATEKMKKISELGEDMLPIYETLFQAYEGDAKTAYSAVQKRLAMDKMNICLNRVVKGGSMDEFQAKALGLDEYIYTQSRLMLQNNLYQHQKLTPDLNRILINRGRGVSTETLMRSYMSQLCDVFPVVLATPSALLDYAVESKFDYLIVDEGSQMPIAEFLVLMHNNTKPEGKVIVSGDPKQLPPNQFFKPTLMPEDDIYFLPNALEETLAISAKHVHLGVHYRSPKQTISLSNKLFYEDKLKSFSAPEGVADIELVYVPNGVYERGTSRRNEGEAKAVLEYLHSYLDSAAENTSIGVITPNISQVALLESLLKKDIELAKELEQKQIALEVMSIESCQGKEFNLVLYTVTYGHDEEGKLSNNMGPISVFGGERRLNVVISRAKDKLVLITSLSSDDLYTLSDENIGIRVLKEILRGAAEREIVLKLDPMNTSIREALEEILPEGYKVSECNEDSELDLCIDDEKNGQKIALMWHNITDTKVATHTLADIYKTKGWTQTIFMEPSDLFILGKDKFAQMICDSILKKAA